MNRFFHQRNADYAATLQKGVSFVRGLRGGLTDDTGSREDNLRRLKKELEAADAVVIGAGAGLSTSAGLTYSGERFERYFFDFKERFGITDMYSGGFFPFPDEETRWAWWARHIYYNRYVEPPKPVYRALLALLREKDYFVLTTNVDHQFQRAGFDRKRLFYTQGDYGLFQSVDPSVERTFDNEAWVLRAMEAQGFVRDADGVFEPPAGAPPLMRLPPELIPGAPDGSPVKLNLRSDDTFVEDEGWHRASAAYAEFLSTHRETRTLYLEIGVGGNTPAIIKYPFWAMTEENPSAVYACLNYDGAFCPKQLESRSICIDGDAGELIRALSACP